ncbi:hypothetical protein [Leptothoe spongobia]|uniref:Uncharacterized protein n=1 Tax=Leptothoe spongobia TAU-MAC 1115 TaxID=1967444 RepID=A0A947DCI6_9CYAN|nr:hypothetical protein [Leptothoe spongobia]MBT9314537.1 hypothetical protein [Leptothoe spongobia TAU-MAC 1115]
MYEQIERPKDNQSQSVANDISQKLSCVESIFQFVDNRPENVAQRVIKKVAKNGGRKSGQLVSQVPKIQNSSADVVQTDSESAILQRVQSFGNFLTANEQSEDRVSNSYYKRYLKNVLKPLADKGAGIKAEVFYKGKDTYDDILAAVAEIGSKYQTLFEFALDNEGVNHSVANLQQRLLPIMADLTTIESFVIPQQAIDEAYEQAAFKGSYSDFVAWVAVTKDEEAYSGLGNAIAVMTELEKNFPMLFEWIKPDIMCTRDKRFFIKEDVYGDRVAAATSLRKVITEHQLQKTAGPEKTAMVLGGQNVAIVKGMPLQEVDDMEVEEKFASDDVVMLSEVGFLIVTTGVGDAAPVNIRKLVDVDKHAFIDTGGNYAHTSAEGAPSVDEQTQTNYESFLDTLPEQTRSQFKPWADLERPLARPAAILR